MSQLCNVFKFALFYIMHVFVNSLVHLFKAVSQ